MIDALSDVLQTVRLTGGLFLIGRFTAPWCFQSQVGLEDCRPHLTRALQIVAYHHVVAGSMQVSTANGETIEAQAGEPPPRGRGVGHDRRSRPDRFRLRQERERRRRAGPEGGYR